MKKNSSIRYFRIFLLSWVLFFVFSMGRTSAQIEQAKEIVDEYEMDLHTLSLYGENLLFFETGDFAYNFGTRLDLQTGIFGFYYKVGVGANPSGKLYMHVPLGVEAGVVLAAYAVITPNGCYLLLPALLCAMVPEGMTVRVWQRNNYNFKLYFSPWGSELNISKENFTLISGEFGVQASVINKSRYNLSCYAGTKALYKHFQPAAVVGATVGILLD